LREDAACFAGFHTLVLIGETFPRSLARRLAQTAPELAVINGYGPAETAILATVCRVAAAEDGPVPLGRALPGYRSWSRVRTPSLHCRTSRRVSF